MADTRYDPVARFFHWTTAALVLATVPIGITMAEIVSEGPFQDQLYVLHELIGLTIFGLTLLRLFWRFGHGAPRPSTALNWLEIAASRIVHALLYLVLFAMAATGYVLVVAGDYPLSYFDLFAVPRLVGKAKDVSDLAEAGHHLLQWVVYALVAAHVGAALHHHFVRGNDVLRRMLPRLAGERRT